MFYRSWKSTKFMDFRGTKHQLPYLTSGIVCFLLACRGSTGSPEEFLSDHLSLSKSGLNAVQVPPAPPGAPRPPLVPWIPLYCVSQDRPIRHVPLPPPYYTVYTGYTHSSAVRSFIGSPFSGCNVTSQLSGRESQFMRTIKETEPLPKSPTNQRGKIKTYTHFLYS